MPDFDEFIKKRAIDQKEILQTMSSNKFRKNLKRT